MLEVYKSRSTRLVRNAVGSWTTHKGTGKRGALFLKDLPSPNLPYEIAWWLEGMLKHTPCGVGTCTFTVVRHSHNGRKALVKLESELGRSSIHMALFKEQKVYPNYCYYGMPSVSIGQLFQGYSHPKGGFGLDVLTQKVLKQALRYFILCFAHTLKMSIWNRTSRLYTETFWRTVRSYLY